MKTRVQARFVRGVVVGCAMTLLASAAAKAQLPPTPTDPSRAPIGPRLFVAQRLQDLGRVIEGDKVIATWVLENRGGADLIIEHASASCGCTLVKLEENEKTIPPGKTMDLKAEFDSTGRRDLQAKTVTVYCNDQTEPEMHLEFKAQVDPLVEFDPPGMVNLRAVRRGDRSERTLAVYPGRGRSTLAIRGIELDDETSLAVEQEPFTGRQGSGQRFRWSIKETAALGGINVMATVKVTVDGIERDRVVPIRGEVVTNLSWLPKVVDTTRLPSLPGKRLTPISLRSTEKTPFRVTGTSAGELLDVIVNPPTPAETQSDYTITLQIKDSARPGPFAASLRVQTDLLDQPVVEIPVFGIVASIVDVEPPMILLRSDGTPVGMKRRIKLQAGIPSTALEVQEITSDNPAVSAAIDRQASSRYHHIRIIEVTLKDGSSGAAGTGVLKVRTTTPGAELIEIPILIERGG